MSVGTIMLYVALLCFILATFGVNAKINLVAAGLAFWLLSMILR